VIRRQALTITGSDGRVTVGGGATDATIIIGDAQVDGGTLISVDVSLETGTQVAGTQNDIEFAGVLTIAAKAQGTRMVPDCTPNAAINKGGTSFAFQPSNCTPGTDCTGIRALVLSLSDVEPIPTGSVLYSCKVDVADTEGGDFPLPCANPGSSDPNGGALSTDCMDGTITVGGGSGGTPTVTPTNTPPVTGGTPTNTAGASPTATRTGGGGGGTPTRVPTAPKSFDDDGCAIVAPAQSGSAWMLLLPAAALLWLRRRSR
jgi:MYXO-CTERM domain-containing protein